MTSVAIAIGRLTGFGWQGECSTKGSERCSRNLNIFIENLREIVDRYSSINHLTCKQSQQIIFVCALDFSNFIAVLLPEGLMSVCIRTGIDSRDDGGRKLNTEHFLQTICWQIKQQSLFLERKNEGRKEK